MSAEKYLQKWRCLSQILDFQLAQPYGADANVFIEDTLLSSPTQWTRNFLLKALDEGKPIYVRIIPVIPGESRIFNVRSVFLLRHNIYTKDAGSKGILYAQNQGWCDGTLLKCPNPMYLLGEAGLHHVTTFVIRDFREESGKIPSSPPFLNPNGNIKINTNRCQRVAGPANGIFQNAHQQIHNQPLGGAPMHWSFGIATPCGGGMSGGAVPHTTRSHSTAGGRTVLLPTPPDCNRLSAPAGRMSGGKNRHNRQISNTNEAPSERLQTNQDRKTILLSRIIQFLESFTGPYHVDIFVGGKPLHNVNSYTEQYLGGVLTNNNLWEIRVFPGLLGQMRTTNLQLVLQNLPRFCQRISGRLYVLNAALGNHPVPCSDPMTMLAECGYGCYSCFYIRDSGNDIPVITQKIVQLPAKENSKMSLSADGNKPQTKSTPREETCSIKPSWMKKARWRPLKQQLKKKQKRIKGSPNQKVLKTSTKSCKLNQKRLKASLNKSSKLNQSSMVKTSPAELNQSKLTVSSTSKMAKQSMTKNQVSQIRISTKSTKQNKSDKRALTNSNEVNQKRMKAPPSKFHKLLLQSPTTSSARGKRRWKALAAASPNQDEIKKNSSSANHTPCQSEREDCSVSLNLNRKRLQSLSDISDPVCKKRLRCHSAKSCKSNLNETPTVQSSLAITVPSYKANRRGGRKRRKALAAASHKQDQTKKNSSSANSTSCESEREDCCSVSLNLNRKRSQSLSDASDPACKKRLRRHSAKSCKSNLNENEIPTVQSPLAITVPSYKANQKSQTTVLSIPSESPASIEERIEEEAASPKQESPTTIQPILKIKEEQEPFRVTEETRIFPLEAGREDLWPTGTKQENPTSPFKQEPDLWPILIKEERSIFSPLKQETDMEGMLPFRIKEERSITPCLKPEPELKDAQPVRIHEERPTTPPCKEQTEMKGLMCVRIKEERSTTSQDDEEAFASTSDGQKKSDVPRDCTRSHQVNGINQNKVTTPVCAEDESTNRQSCRLNLDEKEVPEQSFYHSRTTTSPSRCAYLHHDAKRCPHLACSSQKETKLIPNTTVCESTLPPICTTWREGIERQCLEEKNKLVQEVMLDMCDSHINEYASYLRQPDAHPDYVEEYKKFKDGERKYVMCSYIGTSEFTEGWEKYWSTHIFNCFEKCWEEHKLHCKSMLSDFTSLEPPPKKMCKDKRWPMFRAGGSLVSEPVPFVPALALLTYVKDRVGIREVPVNMLYDNAVTLERMGWDPTRLLQNEETAYIFLLLKTELQYILTEKTFLVDDSTLMSKAQSILQALMSITNLQLGVNLALIAQFTMHKNMRETANFIHKIILEKSWTLSENDERAINKAVLDEKLNRLT